MLVGLYRKVSQRARVQVSCSIPLPLIKLAVNCSTPLPQIDETMDQLPWRWDDIETSTANNLPPQPSMYSSTFLESAKLSRIMQRVMATL